jgi:hypothetical protein
VPAGTRNPELFNEFLGDLMRKISRLGEGEVMLMPGGWLQTDDPEGDLVMYVLEKKKDKTFRFAVVDTNQESPKNPRYHLSTYAGTKSEGHNNPPVMKHQLTFVLDNIHPDRCECVCMWKAFLC